MIYNYKSGSPVVVTPTKANEYFPDFDFEEDYLFFIYPDDYIIYNFTLGLFFELDKHGDYYEIQPPGILGAKGNFVGYTQADPNQLPTLYYQNGRLTLQHAHCRNIGWHPRKHGYNYISGNVLSPNNPRIFANGTQFDINQFNVAVAAVNPHNIQNAQLIELYYDANDTIVSRHVSRSYRIPNQPPNFQLNAVNEFTAANEFN